MLKNDNLKIKGYDTGIMKITISRHQPLNVPYRKLMFFVMFHPNHAKCHKQQTRTNHYDKHCRKRKLYISKHISDSIFRRIYIYNFFRCHIRAFHCLVCYISKSCHKRFSCHYSAHKRRTMMGWNECEYFLDICGKHAYW